MRNRANGIFVRLFPRKRQRLMQAAYDPRDQKKIAVLLGLSKVLARNKSTQVLLEGDTGMLHQ
jgi:hypothetical protein